ncbi:NAD-glutamate dehydrogenase domain-containing protein, partial [Nocardia cyriacigeorgica]|uniref:NAD-glutamate dehydrogenase domain-containing protein n=1 Tax=Nocardia cyriacigeorgica TaxID=135487 RepID=UPI003CC7D691
MQAAAVRQAAAVPRASADTAASAAPPGQAARTASGAPADQAAATASVDAKAAAAPLGPGAPRASAVAEAREPGASGVRRCPGFAAGGGRRGQPGTNPGPPGAVGLRVRRGARGACRGPRAADGWRCRATTAHGRQTYGQTTRPGRRAAPPRARAGFYAAGGPPAVPPPHRRPPHPGAACLRCRRIQRAAASKLTAARTKAAGKLAEAVSAELGGLAMGKARLEDFRTEILGLVKAQAVKNAVIVPVGAKGGFV